MKNKINRLMNDIEIPPPDAERKQKTIYAAVAEFKKNAVAEKKIKGSQRERRLIDTFHSIIDIIEGGIMKKSLKIGGTAVCLLFLVVGSVKLLTFTRQSEIEIASNIERTAPEDVPKGMEPKVREKILNESQSDAQAVDYPKTAESDSSDEGALALKADPFAPIISPTPASPAPAPEAKAETAIRKEVRALSASAPQSVLTKDFSANIAPREVGRDKFEKTQSNPLKLVSEQPVSTFSIDVDTASYAFIRRQLNSGVLPQKNAVRIEEMINYFSYDYPTAQTREQPFKPTVALFQTPWNPDTKLLHIGIKGYDIQPEHKPRSNLVFLIDASGSMSSDDKLPLLKNAFRMLVDSLDKEDLVSVVVYAGAAGTVLEPTKVSEKHKIIASLDRLSAGGSTAGGEGIRQAYALAEANFDKKGVNRVILATDGDFNVGITNEEELKSFIERKRKTGIYLSVLGFGQGNYNDALMQTLAQNGNGNAAYIDNLNEARKVLVEQANSTLFTIAKDVKIQIEFNPRMVAEYRLIGYETRMLKREDFNNDAVDAGDIGSGHSVTAIYEIIPPGSKARLIGDLRYEEAKAEKTAEPSKNEEYAFLKIRYKLPGSEKSELMTTPITAAHSYQNNNDVPPDARFAAAVAAFGQILRGDGYIGKFSYDDIIKLASPALGKDEFGYRNEFLNMVRLAKHARAMN